MTRPRTASASFGLSAAARKCLAMRRAMAAATKRREIAARKAAKLAPSTPSRMGEVIRLDARAVCSFSCDCAACIRAEDATLNAYGEIERAERMEYARI